VNDAEGGDWTIIFHNLEGNDFMFEAQRNFFLNSTAKQND
jgi:hypothetical protein